MSLTQHQDLDTLRAKLRELGDRDDPEASRERRMIQVEMTYLRCPGAVQDPPVDSRTSLSVID